MNSRVATIAYPPGNLVRQDILQVPDRSTTAMRDWLARAKTQEFVNPSSQRPPSSWTGFSYVNNLRT